MISSAARIFLVLSSGSTCYSVTSPAMFFYFQIISILLLPQALSVCTLHIILSSSLGLWSFFVVFYPIFWAGSLRGTFCRMWETSGLAFYSRAPEFIFCHPTSLYRSIKWYATVHRLSRRLWPGTNLQSVLWFWNHKHNMLGAQSCSSSKQPSLFSMADAIWSTWLHLLIIRR